MDDRILRAERDSAGRKIFLGIDPGFGDAGFGVIAVEKGKERCLDYGSIRTTKGAPMPERLLELYDKLAKIIEKHRPSSSALEKLFFAKNARTAMDVAEARGVIRLCLRQHGVPCREFAPVEVKTAVCGYGAAEKGQVQKMVRTLLSLREIPKPNDAADALALAIVAAHTKW